MALSSRRASRRRPPLISPEEPVDVRRFEAAIRRLPRTQRDVLRLRYVLRLSVQDVAAHLRKSPPVTAVLIKKGLQNLRGVPPTFHDPELDLGDESQYHPPVSRGPAEQKQDAPNLHSLDVLSLPQIPAQTRRIEAFFDKVDSRLASCRRSLARYLQRALRALGTIEPETLEEGQAIARRANQLVRTYGLRFRFPGTDSPGSLTFVQLRPDALGIFRLTAQIEGVNRTASIQRDFSKLEIFAPEPGPLRTPSS